MASHLHPTSSSFRPTRGPVPIMESVYDSESSDTEAKSDHSDISDDEEDAGGAALLESPDDTPEGHSSKNIRPKFITEIEDYRKLLYPSKMIGGTPRTRMEKPLDKQLIHPNAFCRSLDRLNPIHRFTIEQYCLAWENAVNGIWGSKMFDWRVFRQARLGLSKTEMAREMEEERIRCINSIRDKPLITRAERLVKHKETAKEKWEKAMRKGDEEKAEKIAARLSKRYAVAGEKLDIDLTQLPRKNQKRGKDATRGPTAKRFEIESPEPESRTGIQQSFEPDRDVIVVYDVPITTSGHELIREGDALAFLRDKEEEPMLSYNGWVRREYERGHGTVEFPAGAEVEFRQGSRGVEYHRR
ncbi:uncharacterized protein PAC_04129 [Phialocephala subalpina]|uniref:Uncharacterized protein n=1 Tax=Phialocephala subalpina TaxID=576137 RepID=A0A1L7WNA7_9HELO|nr:uncharacterized protein PAC_04129 [Phialocephala subalpina]